MILRPFSPKAQQFILTDPIKHKFFTLLEGSVRSGKSFTLLAKIIMLCRYEVDGDKVLMGHTMGTIRRNVLDPLAGIVGSQNFHFNHSKNVLTLFGKHRWNIIPASNIGAENDVRGFTAGVIVWDELTLAPEPVFIQALLRLSPANSRMFASTNPDTKFHHVYQWMTKGVNLKRVERIKFNLDDNPALTEAKKQQYRESYHGIHYRRFILAEWCSGEGSIYGEVLTDKVYFTDAEQPVGLLGQGGHYARYIGVDHGIQNPTVFVDVYDDGKTCWQVREKYMDGRKQHHQPTIGEQADELEKFIGANRRGLTIIVDPAAAPFKAELLKRGLPIKNANNDVVHGIQVMANLFAKGGYRIHRSCEMTRKEHEAYVWDEKACERGDEKPKKFFDHTCDAVRYVPTTMLPKWRI